MPFKKCEIHEIQEKAQARNDRINEKIFTCELGWRDRPECKWLHASDGSLAPLASDRKWAESVGSAGVALRLKGILKYLSGLEMW